MTAVPEKSDVEVSDIRARLTTAGRGNVLMTVAAMAASLVTQAWLGRAFGPAGLGAYAATSLFITVLATVTSLGAPIAGSQRIAHLEESRDRRADEAIASTLGLAIIMGLVAGAIGALSWQTFARLMGIAEAAPASFVFAAIIATVFANSVVSVLLAKLHMLAASVLVLAQPTAVAAGLAASQFGRPIDPSTLASAGFTALGIAAVIWTAAARNTPWLHADETKNLLRGILPATAALYPQILTTWVDRLVVGILAGPAILGAYSAAGAIADGLLRVPRNIGIFAVPAYARLAGDSVGVQRVLDSHIRIVSAFFIVAGTAFIASGAGLLTLIFGDAFAPAATAMQLLLVSLVPAGVSLTLITSAVGTGRQRASTRMLALLLPVQVVTTTVGTAFISIAGAALSQVVVWSVGVVLFFSQSRPEHDSAIVRTIVRIFGVGIPLWVFARVVGSLDAAWLARAILGTVVATAAVSLFVVREPELRIVRRLLARQGAAGGPAEQKHEW